MRDFVKINCLLWIILLLAGMNLRAQEKSFSLEDCINYALEHSTDMGRAGNEVKSQKSWLEQKKAERTPNMMLSGKESLSSDNKYISSTSEWEGDNLSSLNFSLNCSLTLYNGAKLKNAIAQKKIDLVAAESDIQTQRELISLKVLKAYVSVMFAKEQLKNDEAVVEATGKQLELATARKESGVLSPTDYLNIKSQYANDKANLVNSKSNLRVSLVDLMQLMNMPVSDSFGIADPNVDALILSKHEIDAAKVYNIALGLQPSIKSAELDLKSAEVGIKLAKADALPVVALSASVQTLYSNALENLSFTEQISHQVTPTVELSLSIPIYQRKQVKNNVIQAEIAADNIKYNLTDIKNDLRKAIEQACTDTQTAYGAYLSNVEQVKAQEESYRVAEEMFAQGMVNAVDYLTSKNNLTSANTSLTRAKYTLVLQKKIVEYYMGNKIKL